jgi:hypothetical protein
MTPEEIDLMPAGREMDALVAEKVFGDIICKSSMWHVRETKDFALEHWTTCKIHGKSGCVAEPRKFSTDISAAWEVVEKIKDQFEEEAQFNIVHRSGYNGPKGNWHAGFKVWMTKERTGLTADWHWSDILGVAEGETAPLAICRAALKAVSS